MSLLTHLRTFPKKHKLLTALLCIALFFTIKEWIETPSDLGPKMEYVGKVKSGCTQPPLSFICVGPVYTNYYFATDMGPDEWRTYFRHAKLAEDTGEYLPDKPGSHSFSISYFTDMKGDGLPSKDDIISAFHLKRTNKKYLIWRRWWGDSRNY